MRRSCAGPRLGSQREPIPACLALDPGPGFKCSLETGFVGPWILPAQSSLARSASPLERNRQVPRSPHSSNLNDHRATCRNRSASSSSVPPPQSSSLPFPESHFLPLAPCLAGQGRNPRAVPPKALGCRFGTTSNNRRRDRGLFEIAWPQSNKSPLSKPAALAAVLDAAPTLTQGHAQPLARRLPAT